MGFYDERILPHLVNLAMPNRHLARAFAPATFGG
jgi:hypothetical protein